MERILTQFAAADTHDRADLFSSLGIDWTLLLLQTIAFLILLFVLHKWVYPPLVSMLDKRDKDLRTAEKAAQSARDNADKTEKMINEMMRKARIEAQETVAVAQKEATRIIDEATEKAQIRADDLVKAAQSEIASEISAAKKALHDETLQLVAEATGILIKEKVDVKKDSKLIEKAIKEVY